jgi:suppressor of fused-like protein
MSFIRRLLGRPGRLDTSLESSQPPEAVGWLAIDAHLDTKYGGAVPVHWGTILQWRLGGPDPLDGVSAYDHAGPPRHWHYVSYGLSELFEKESADPEVSGWGLELTFRVAHAAASETDPPIWAMSFLQKLARYIFESRNPLWPGHHINAYGPIAAGMETLIRAAVFVEDPELHAIDTPNGSVRFVQVVGVTLDEYDMVRRWNTDSMIELLARGNPLHVTDLDRVSILADPSIAMEAEAGRRAEGSSMSGVYVDRLQWDDSADGLRVTIGAAAVEDVLIMLDGRLPFGREGFLEGEGHRIDLVPGTSVGWHRQDDGLALVLTPDAVASMASLPVATGRYTWPQVPGLTLDVEATIVRTEDGREVDRLG